MEKGKENVGSKSIKANDICMHYLKKGHWKRECPKLLCSADTFVIKVDMITSSASWVLDTSYGAHICNDLQVLERSRKLSRDKVVLKLCDGNVVAVEAVGIVHLAFSDQHDLIMTAQNKRKMDNQENAQIWHARLCHISQDRIKRFVDYPKKTAGYNFYDPSEQKVFVSHNAVFLKKKFSVDTRREELLLEESSKVTPQTDGVTSSAPIVPTNNILVLQRLTKVSQQPERSTQGVKLVRCKWVYKRKLGADGEVATFKVRLVAKGYTQRPRIHFEKIYSPVAMTKSIRIMLAIAAWCDYEIWQMDVKIAFFNGFVEEDICMDQPEGFTFIGEEQKVYHLQRSIYGLKQASRSWNIHFPEVIWGYDFIKNDFDPMYTRRYQTCADEAYWTTVKTILKYLIRIKGMFWIYDGGELILEGYSNTSFQSDEDDAKSQSGFVFRLNGGVVAWKNSKQDTTVDSTTEAEYTAILKAAKEAVCMKNYI
ncbi:UNVERIFIED_CONTAM: hypothetical protein Slati_3476600 [Sesamum latifolium]|uniref:Uncharacterized protein n=1 Tax=Sesamum latifolium TaxID=2727402 RepID=A0AAW2UJC8_9LAMI